VWADDWRWWYQYGYGTDPTWDLTQTVVEARWTTEGHTMGDGTYRGDLQPGRLELKLYDPAERLLNLATSGTIWGHYKPADATFCFFIDSVTSILAAAGDPLRHNLVVTADTWPLRLDASWNTDRPAETVTARLAFLVDRLDTDTNLVVPHWAGDLAADNHTVTAQAGAASGQLYSPGYLDLVRTAAANGVAWVEARASDADYTPGSLVLHYDLWDSVVAHTLHEADYLVGSTWTYGNDLPVGWVQWAGIDAAGVATTVDQVGHYWATYGQQKIGPLRLWGNIAAGGPQEAAVKQTGQNVMDDRAAPVQVVDQIVAVSGDRTTPDGRPSSPWDPASMLWNPLDVLQWFRLAGHVHETYRVTQTAHVLNALGWEATHTLSMFSQPVALP
jgi:hypothetical protein